MSPYANPHDPQKQGIFRFEIKELGKYSEIPSEQLEKSRMIYSDIWVEASALSPTRILGPNRSSPAEGFGEDYYQREEDSLLEETYQNIISPSRFSTIKKHILIIGRPLSGKSRLIYEWLQRLPKGTKVIIPHYQDFKIDSFVIPEISKTNGQQLILLLDDLQRYVDFNNIDYLLNRFLSRTDITIIAMSRSGLEMEKIKSVLLEKNIIIENSFNIIEIKNLNNTMGNKIAEKLKIDWNKKRDNFDGTIGSFFLPLVEMQKRYSNCGNNGKALLHAIKYSYLGGIYVGKLSFLMIWIKKIAKEIFELNLPRKDWEPLVESLVSSKFIKLDNENGLLSIEEVYLDKIISTKTKFSLENFRELSDVFASEIEALVLLSNRLAILGSFTIKNKILVTKTAIEFYQKVLSLIDKKTTPLDYARILQRIGYTYKSLIQVTDAKENCNSAIQIFKETLQIYTKKEYPFEYASLQSSIGATYIVLSKITNTEKNCLIAIEALNESLEIYNNETNLFNFAIIKFELGTVYTVLGEVVNTAENFQQAIEAFESALRFHTIQDYPIEYAHVQLNLGALYRQLANLVNYDYWKQAEKAYEESARIYNREENPDEYGMIKHNLGVLYRLVGEKSNPEKYYLKAIENLDEALNIRTFEDFPIFYAQTQNSLGNVYGKLAEIFDPETNCYLSIQAFVESLKVYTKKEYPIDFAQTQSNLGSTLLKLSEISDMEDNCEKAINAFKLALDIRTKKKNPFYFGITMMNLGTAYSKLALVENTLKNLSQAISIFEEIKSIFTQKNYPEYHQMVLVKLSFAKKGLDLINDAIQAKTKTDYQIIGKANGPTDKAVNITFKCPKCQKLTESVWLDPKNPMIFTTNCCEVVGLFEPSR